MNVTILHDALPAGARPDERDALVQAEAVAGAIARHACTILPVGLDLAALQRELTRRPPDLVFNLVESLGGHGRMIAAVPLLLETLRLPFTGAGGEATFTTSNKLLAKRTLRAAGLPTPDWIEAGALAGGAALDGDWIVKSVWEHGSLGLDDGAVVRGGGAARVAAALAARRDAFGGEGFAERFVDGREFNLALLEREDGVELLPPAEIRFDRFAAERPRIVGYAAKWEPGAFEYEHTPRRFTFGAEDAALLAELTRLARAAWHRFGLRGWARVDFRVDPERRPWILEVNTNPCLAPDAGFAAALAQAGVSFAGAIERIVAAALRAPVPEREVPAPRGLRDAPEPADVEKVRALVERTGFFRPAEVRIAAELVEERLQRGAASGYEFLLRDDPDDPSRLLGYACYGPIDGTESSWDLFWIAVDPRAQRAGIGSGLLRECERRIAAVGGRRVYVETGGREMYAPTRAFYERCGYGREAVLEGFYAEGDAKVVYVRDVGGPAGS